MVSKVVVMTTTMIVMYCMMIMYSITVFLTVGRMLACVVANGVVSSPLSLIVVPTTEGFLFHLVSRELK